MTIRKPEDVVTPLDFSGMDQTLLKTLYLRMVRAREFEERLYYLFLICIFNKKSDTVLMQQSQFQQLFYKYPGILARGLPRLALQNLYQH